VSAVKGVKGKGKGKKSPPGNVTFESFH